VFEVGYVDAEEMFEFSCALREGEHIHGWEFFKLSHVRAAGRLMDGQPIKNVRVVFIDETVAQTEKRPLLDVSLCVYYYDQAGYLTEVA